MKAHKIIKSVLALSLAVIAVSSCQEKMKGFGFSKGEVVRFSVGTEGSSLDTKAAYAGNTTTPGEKERIDWEENDLIRIYCDAVSEPETHFADYKVTGNPTSSGALSKAHIEGTGGVGLRWGTGDHYFYAVYPSPASNGITKGIEGKDVSANLAAEQGYKTATSADNSWTVTPDLKWMLMTAKSGPYKEGEIPAGKDNEDVFLEFHPLTTAVKFTVTNGTTSAMPIKKVMLISKASKISGTFSVDLDASPSADGYLPTGGTPAGTEVSIDLSAKSISLAAGKSLTFTFFLAPTQDIDDLTFRFYKDGTNYMQTRLGYTDGSGVNFPRCKKTTVKGIMLPEGVQWTVKYEPGVDRWGTGGGDIKPNPEVSGKPFVTSWNAGIIDEPLALKPEKSVLLPGMFSVSTTEYVQFSRGSLYCTDKGSGVNPRYKFDLEEHQYDYRGRSGKSGDKAVIDGLEKTTPAGTSGLFQWVSENAAVKSSDVSKFNDARACFGAFSELTSADLKGLGGEYIDFGKAYGDGTLLSSLSLNEWEYLLNSRPNAKNLRSLSTVCGVKGYVFAPDDWTGGKPASSYDASAWAAAESAGLVFLPAGGYFDRYNNDVEYVGTYGYNWSYSADDGDPEKANRLLFHYGATTTANPEIYISAINRQCGIPVRLVKRSQKTIGYVEIAAQYDGENISTLKWATENLAITPYGLKEWKGEGEGTGHIVGDYFQWGAYAGYCGNATDIDKGLVLYKSFSCKGCGDSSDAFSMKSGKNFNAASAPFIATTSPVTYSKYTVAPATLASEHDAANIVLGGNWRMPTTGEIVAMRKATYWVWDNTDKGYYICLPSGTCEAGGSGTSFPSDTDKAHALLFIPASGYGKYTTSGTYLFVKKICNIWTSSLYDEANAYNLYFGGTGADPVGILPDYHNLRYYGFSIRPVADE